MAGLVWSAHTECTADQLRSAISATAQDKGDRGRDKQYGFGIVKALAAHNYLLANPCSSRTMDCVGSWGTWSACNATSGVQVSTFKVTQTATGEGKPCEAADGAVRSQPCSAVLLAVNDAVQAPMNQRVQINVIANDAGDVAAITLPSLKSKNGGNLKLLPSPDKILAGKSIPSDSKVAYISRLGFRGLDSFEYTVLNGQGANSTAQVTVNVTAGSCSTHACTGGSCVDGVCRCKPGSGLSNAWILNPKKQERGITPRVPACRFRTFRPVAPFSLEGCIAPAGKAVNLEVLLSASSPPACFGRTAQPVATATFLEQRGSQAASCKGESVLTSSQAAPGSVTCSAGKYAYVVKAPSAPGCYTLSLQLADGTARSANVQVVG